MAKSWIASEQLIKALQDNGVIDPSKNVRRVVIDIRAHNLPIVHIEQFGDDRLLSVVRALGPEVQVVDTAADVDLSTEELEQFKRSWQERQEHNAATERKLIDWMKTPTGDGPTVQIQE